MSNFLEKGNRYYNEGNYRKAIKCYQKGIERELDHQLELAENIGDAYIALKKYRKAIEYFDLVLTEVPENQTVLSSKWEALSKLTEKFFDNEEFERTIRYCKKALTIKQNADLWLRKGNANFNIAAYKEAIDCYNKALEQEPNDRFEILEELGNAYLKLKKYAKAIQYFDQVLEKNPENKMVLENKCQALGQLANGYFKDQNYKKSIKYYEKALAIKESAKLWFNKGEVRFDMQEYKNALICYKKALNNQPENHLKLSVLKNIAKTHVQLENHVKVIKYCDKVLAISPKNKSMLDEKYKASVILAKEYDDKKEYKNAINYYKEAISIKPSADLWLKKGNAFFNDSNYEESIHCYKNALEKNPENKLELLENIGDAYLKLENYLEATKYLDKVLVEDPANETVISNTRSAFTILAKKYFADEQYKKAITYYKKAIDLKPSAYLWFGKGNSHFNLEDYDEAINCYQESLKYDPKNRLRLLEYIGGALEGLGKYAKAIEYFDQVLEQAPENKSVLESKQQSLIQLAEKHSDQEQYQEAIKCYDQAIAMGANAHLWSKKGTAHSKEKDYNNAIICYDNALKLQPENSLKLLERKGMAFHSLEQYAKAVENFDQILETNPQNEEVLKKKLTALEEWAASYERDKHYQKAAEIYSQALTLKPDPSLWLKQGEAWFHVPDYSHAIACFNRVLAQKRDHQDAQAMKVKALREQGKLLFKAKNYAEAEKYYSELIEMRNGVKVPDEIALADIFFYLQKIEDSIDCYGRINKSALILYKENYQKALLMKANHLYQENRLAEAKRYFQKICNDIEPCNIAQASIAKIDADITYSYGWYEKAKNLYLKALVIIGGDAKLRDICELNGIVVTDSVDLSEVTVQRKVHLCELHIEARNCEAGKEFDQALKYYQKITELTPDDTIALSRLREVKGDIAYHQKNMHEALAFYQQAYDINKKNMSVKNKEKIICCIIEGKDFSKKGDFSKAALAYNELLKIDKNNTNIFEKKTKILLKLAVECISKKKYDKAKEVVLYVINDTRKNFKNGLKDNEFEYYKVKSNILLGDLFVLDNNPKEALKEYDIALAMRPDDLLIAARKLYAGFLVLSKNQLEIQDETSISLAKSLKKIIETMPERDDPLLDSLDFSKDTELMSTKTFTELPIEQIEALIEEFVGKKNTKLLDSQDDFAKEIEMEMEEKEDLMESKSQSVVLSDSQTEFAEEIEKMVEEETLPVVSKKRHREDENTVIKENNNNAFEGSIVLKREPRPTIATSEPENKKLRVGSVRVGSKLYSSIYRNQKIEIRQAQAPLAMPKEKESVEWVLEEKALPIISKKRSVEETIATIEPSAKKSKKRPLPTFKPKIKNFAEVASKIPFETEKDPATFLAKYQQTTPLSESNEYTPPQESEEERMQRERAKEEVADKIGFAGENLVYEKLKSHYIQKYNASLIEPTKGLAIIKGHYPNHYTKAPHKAAKSVHLKVEWYNGNSKSCKDTFNDHDLQIIKKVESEAESTRSVEVKTTCAPHPKTAKFSERELARMKKDYDQYRIFRVYNIEAKNPEIRKFKNPYKAMFGEMDPEFSLASLSITI